MNIRNINLAAASSNIINPAFGAMRSKTDAEMLSMLGTKPGGAANMELWSARNSTANPPTYTRNPNLWCNELVSQLTAAVAYKDDVTGGKQSYGGILISPRHVLYCEHSKPHARNTWFVNYNSTKECNLHFVLANGSVVEAVQIAQTTVRPTRDRPGAYTPTDYPTDTIYSQTFAGGTNPIVGTTSTVGGIVQHPERFNGLNSTWTGANIINLDGNSTSNSGAISLPFTPQSGYIYDLTANINVTAGNNSWFGVGFLEDNSAYGFYANKPAALRRSTGWEIYPQNTAVSVTSNEVTVRLDTSIPQWRISIFQGGVQIGSTYTYTTNPKINYVGFVSEGTAVASVSVFKLTVTTSAQDLCVAVLDRDVQALGVHVMPIPKLTLQDLGYISTPAISHIHVTQGYERTTSSIPPTPRSDYPQYHNSMVAVGHGSMSMPPLNSTLTTIDYAVWDGDSGTPSMMLLNGKLYLHRLIGASNIPNNIGHINAMIAVAEDDAISRGRLAARTGITVPLVPVVI
jgi:hypothetical protein